MVSILKRPEKFIKLQNNLLVVVLLDIFKHHCDFRKGRAIGRLALQTLVHDFDDA